MTADLIFDSLERASQKCADPAPLVYRRLFELHPELEALFLMDSDGGVRGSMLQTCLTAILGLAESSPTPRFIIAAARMDHPAFGVKDDQFDLMFAAIRDTFRDLLGADWTADTDAAWTRLLDDIASIE